MQKCELKKMRALLEAHYHACKNDFIQGTLGSWLESKGIHKVRTFYFQMATPLHAVVAFNTGPDGAVCAFLSSEHDWHNHAAQLLKDRGSEKLHRHRMPAAIMFLLDACQPFIVPEFYQHLSEEEQDMFKYMMWRVMKMGALAPKAGIRRVAGGSWLNPKDIVLVFNPRHDVDWVSKSEARFFGWKD